MIGDVCCVHVYYIVRIALERNFKRNFVIRASDTLTA